MSVLLIEKINHRFKRITGTRQASGLTICTKMIADSVDGVVRAEVDNLQHVEHAISYHKPRKVLIQGIWLSFEQMNLLRQRYPRILFFLHIHSNIPFLAADAHAFHRFKEARSCGFGIVFNDERALPALPGSTHLPNIYRAKKPSPARTENDGFMRIVCAGSLRPMKNHATQALAAIRFAESRGQRLKFYAQMGRSEGGDAIRSILQGIFMVHTKHELISMPWMEHNDFLSFLTSMDYGMQVSLSESFNLVAADYTTAGLPMVVSPEVSWASVGSMASTGSIEEISKALSNCHRHKAENSERLLDFSRKSIEAWNAFASA